MLLFRINGIRFFATYFFQYLPHSPQFCSHLHGLRYLKLQCLSWYFFTDSAGFTIFSAILLLVLFNERSLVSTCMINKPGLKSLEVGFRWSYISIVFTVVKSLTLTENLWLMDLVSRYQLIFFYYAISNYKQIFTAID